MTADHLSYKRATTVSLIGLGIQAVLGVTMLVDGRLVGDPAAITASLAMLLGIPCWLALALVFHQHRLERLEAMEAEAYAASSAAQASVFEEAGTDILGQARRLAWMHKWFLPAVSLIVASAMLGIGLLRFFQTRESLDIETAFSAPRNSGWAISIGVATAVVGFIFARFVAGMAKQKAWSLLHAGSATAVGAAIFGAAIAVLNFVVVAGASPSLLRFLAPALAIAMVALGAEMFLNLVLNLYRPRAAGEFPRPAFDSRVLAFLAAPDRLAESISEAINYQFGFNVSSTWFYRLLARSVASLVVLGLFTLWALSIFTIVRPEERGLLVRNGRLVSEVGSGLVVDLPWPWSHVERFPAEAVNQIDVGSPAPSAEGPILWTNSHSPNEKFLLVQPSRLGREGGAGASAGDLNLVAAEVPIRYTVKDMGRYNRLAQDGPSGREDQVRRDLLTAEASSVVIEFLATLSVDDVLGARRQEIAARIRQLVQERFESLEAGVEVMFAGISGVHPEQSVAPAFEEVVAADQKRLSAVETAQAEAIRTLAGVVGDVDRARAIIAELDALEKLKNEKAQGDATLRQEQRVLDLIVDAGGEAAVLISEARAERWRKHLEARARLASSEGQIASYRAAPLPFRVALYLRAIGDATRKSRVYITPFERMRLRINREEQEAMVSGFDPMTQAEKDAQEKGGQK